LLIVINLHFRIVLVDESPHFVNQIILRIWELWWSQV